ncbi:hypothetical protein BSL78_11950 [Apostichopus japonicus]|uniref:Uncharacterized protein n=1 Tax=Stichopus japonicus TaxID=307972 RepID=A0A2G8KT98_STIJA|nr:hypothetical protein BSL78_11950 [Apostichopus japonicus]
MVSEHMAHREQTQASYYKASQSEETACAAASIITNLLVGSQSEDPADAPAGPSGLQSTTPESDASSDQEDIPSSAQFLAAEPLHRPPHDQQPLEYYENPKRARASYFEGDTEDIMKTYRDTLERLGTSKITIKEVVRKMYNDNRTLQQWTVQQLYDKVRKSLD